MAFHPRRGRAGGRGRGERSTKIHMGRMREREEVGGYDAEWQRGDTTPRALLLREGPRREGIQAMDVVLGGTRAEQQQERGRARYSIASARWGRLYGRGRGSSLKWLGI